MVLNCNGVKELIVSSTILDSALIRILEVVPSSVVYPYIVLRSRAMAVETDKTHLLLF